MLADTEALDDFFAAKYTGGDSNTFLDLCSRSVKATDQHLDKARGEFPNCRFMATSFLGQFGCQFLETEKVYYERLTENYASNHLKRVDVDISHRLNMYRQMYGQRLDHDFLVKRTIRTMAQYLTLGELIGEDPQSCIIVHDTVNAALFQDINRFQDPGAKHHKPISPVIPRDVRVYQ